MHDPHLANYTRQEIWNPCIELEPNNVDAFITCEAPRL
jgi:hypothetical protein